MELKFIKKYISEDIDFRLPNTILHEVPTMDRANLNEFILHTVPTEKVAKYLTGCFNFTDYSNFDNEKNYGIIVVPRDEFIQLFIREKDEEDIKKIMGKMGWFCSARNLFSFSRIRLIDTEKKISDSGLFGLQFEKKFNDDETIDVKSECNFLYHYTLKMLLGKIDKIGLIPKISTWDLFGGEGKKYTNKLYKNTNDIVNSGKIYLFKEKRRRAFFSADYFKQKNNFVRDKEFVCLKIDVKKLPDNIKFYEDPKQEGAVYTYDNIPPTAIEIEKV